MALPPYDPRNVGALPALDTQDPSAPLRMLASFQQQIQQPPSSSLQSPSAPSGLVGLQPPPGQPPAQSYGLPSYDELAKAAHAAAAPALPAAQPEKPLFDFGNTVSALKEGISDQLVPGIKGAAAQLYTGLDRPDQAPEWARNWMTESRTAMEQGQARQQELAKQGQTDSTSESIREAIPSLGFSTVAMGAALPAGIAGTALTTPVGGAVAAGTAAGAAGYRMAGSQFLSDTFSKMDAESQKQRGRPMSEEEKAKAYEALLQVAQNTALWEAGPEAIGNAAMFGLGKVALGLMPKEAMLNIAKTTLGRMGVRAGAAAGAMGTEVATEGVTQVAQGNDQAKADAAVQAAMTGQDMKAAMDAAPKQYEGVEGLWQAIKDVGPATIATTLMMGAAAKPIHMAYSAVQNRREGNAAANAAEESTEALRANLNFARETDLADALANFDAIEAAGNLPKAAAQRIDAARQQLAGELALRATPDALADPIDTARGRAGYLGFAGRVNELSDDQLIDVAQRPLPANAPAEIQDAQAAYGKEIQRRQDLTLAASHFDTNPAAVSGVANTLSRIASGKPMTKGAHGSVDYNLASISDDMLSRYRLAAEVLLRDKADALGNRAEPVRQAFTLMNEEATRRAEGNRRDPQSIRESDIAAKVAASSSLGTNKKAVKKLVDGMPPDAIERMVSGLQSRLTLEPELAGTITALQEEANRSRSQAFNPQGTQGIQSALQQWNRQQTPASPPAAPQAQPPAQPQPQPLPPAPAASPVTPTPQPQPIQATPAAPPVIAAPPPITPVTPQPAASPTATPPTQPQGPVNASPPAPQTQAQPPMGVPTGPEGTSSGLPGGTTQPAPPPVLGQVNSGPDNQVIPQPTQTPAEKRAARNAVAPNNDSLLTAIAKLGGLDRAEAVQQGIDPADLRRMPVFGMPVFRKSGGKTFDAIAESLSELGYPVKDEAGNYSPNVLLDRVWRELSGTPSYTPGGFERIAQQDAEERARLEEQANLDSWAIDEADLEESGFDSLDDQGKITAELQAAASRDLGEAVADEIFERVSNRHESSSDEQFNTALKEAFDNERKQRESQTSGQPTGQEPQGAPESPAAPASAPEQQTQPAEEVAPPETARNENEQPGPAGKRKPVSRGTKTGQDSSGPEQKQPPATASESAAKAAPRWNNASEAERETLMQGAGHSASFSQRKAKEWPTWSDIPEGPVKQRLRDSLTLTPETVESTPTNQASTEPTAPTPKPSQKQATQDKAAPPAKKAEAAPKAIVPTELATESGQHKLADKVKDFLISSKENLSPQKFWSMANESFGGKQSQGAYSSKDAYDAMELGLNLVVIDSKENGTSPKEMRDAVRQFEALQNRLPTQTKRDDEQQRMQQFSTPHPHAHVAAWVAVLSPDDVVLEPTAGTGNIVAHAKLMGAGEIVANELSARRASLLDQIPGVRVFQENANHLNALLPKDVKPTAVIMNPPFSADVNQPGKKVLTLGADHITEAISRLQDGGRLVAIVGRGMSMNAPRFREWWQGIEKKYNVRANVAISGKEYTKFGTSFDNRFLVIDKTGPTASRDAIVTGEVSKVEELIPLLKGVRDERIHAVQQQPASPASQKGAEGNEGGNRLNPVVPTPTDQDRATDQGTVPRVEPAASGPTDGAGLPGRNAGTGNGASRTRTTPGRGGIRGRSDGPGSGRPDSGAGGEAEIQPVGTRSAAQKERALEIETGAMSPTDEDGFGDSVFESYRPSGTIKGAKPHPTKLAESAAMSAVRLPKLTYVPNIPSEIVDSGKLSGAQLETIAYAGQAHEQMLPNGERRGMFVGDGCVSGDTMIFDPETGESTQIEALARRGKPITVLALSKDGFVAANATAPFLKGKDDIYRVTLRSGKQVKVTMAHRFLTPEGWRHLRWISQGDCIASAGTALSSHPLVDHYATGENDPNSLRKPEDCLFDCRSYPHLCDEQPHREVDTYGGVSQGEADALEYIRDCHDEDGLGGHLRGHIHRCQCTSPPSKNSSSPASSLALSLIERQDGAAHALLSEGKPQCAPQSRAEKEPLHRSEEAINSYRLERASCSFQPSCACEPQPFEGDRQQMAELSHSYQLSPLSALRQCTGESCHQSVLCPSCYDRRWETIESIEFVCHDDFYDMYVPGYENYVANGIIHHNTGVGKGAQIAGIILDNWNRGRKKALWVSENAGLFNDAQRDAEWSGLGKDKLFLQGKVKGEIASKEGVAFTTYATLRNAERDKGETKGLSRLDQMVSWLGKDFDGVIAFDEAHVMANATTKQGSRGVSKPSQSALVGIELQKLLPKARVVYVSATGATEVSNLAYATRLGLWGEGTAFSGRDDFISNIEAGGLAAMEVVAKDMKSLGAYTARSLSYDGVEVEPLLHPLTKQQADMYNTMAHSWQLVLSEIDAALKESGGNKNPNAKSSAKSAFWGAHQRFFNSVLTSLSGPSLIADMQRQLDAGNSVVGQLVNTNEAATERRIAQSVETGQELDELDFSPRDVLMQYLHNSFPTALHETFIDEDGNEKSRPVVDSKGDVVQDPAATARRDALLEDLATLHVPDGILDQLINHFGSDSVAEITGRARRVVKKKNGETTIERLGEAKRKSDASAFDSGKKRILIFSDAGGTGRSYHADLRIPNQEKRIHYLIQPGWRADKAIQGLGRTHRTNQKQPPLFKTVSTDIKSQARFVSSIARRMGQMGALTKGQRDAAAGSSMFDDDMNLEDEYSRTALTSLFTAIAKGREQGITAADISKQMGIDLVDAKSGEFVPGRIPSIQQFLNRLLSLDIPMMDKVFRAFEQRRKMAIEYAKSLGSYDGGMETLRAKSVRKAEEKEVMKHASGAATNYVKLVATHDQNFIPYEGLQTDARFVRNNKSGRVYALEDASAITNTTTGEIVDRVRRVSPVGARYITEKEAISNYETLSLDDKGKRAAWEKESAEYPKTYDEPIHMVSGVLLPVWDRLNSGSAGNKRVVRVQTTDGERLIGRVIDNANVGEVLKNLNVDREQIQLTGQQAIQEVLDRKTLVLANDWRIARRVVNGEPRIEVLGTSSRSDQELLKTMGAFSEIINWQSRVFLPVDQPAVMDRLLKSKPITDVVEPSNRYSRPATRGGQTIKEARDSLSRVLGAKQVAALERDGRLVLHSSDPTKTGAAGYVDDNGVIHLIPANMDQSALDVALHEGMHLARDDRFSEGHRAKIRLAHAAMRVLGLKQFIGSPGFTDLAQQVQRMAAEGNAVAMEAMDKALLEWRADPTVDVAEEAVSYLAQYANHRIPLVRRILAAVRAALYRMGVHVQLTPADVRALAVSALKSQAKTARRSPSTRAATAFSQPSNEADEQARLWAEFQAVRAQFQERQSNETAFNRWFGKGTEGVTARDGRPITLYHGTNNPEFNQWDEARSGAASGHPTAGLGFFMTADKRSAARYGSRLLELNARINKPYYLTDADLVRIDDVRKASQMRKKLMAQGYDGAVVSAPGAAPYVIAFESNQVKHNSNENPTDSPDFRYSRPSRRRQPMDSPRMAAHVLDDIGGLRSTLKPAEKTLAKSDPRNWMQMLADLKSTSRPQWLGLLTQDMLVNLAKEELPAAQVSKFDAASEAMDAYESRMIQDDAFPIAERWQDLMRKDRQQADAVGRTLYLSTWLGADPRKAAAKGKQAEWTRTKGAYDSLNAEGKKLYSDVVDFYEKQTRRLFKELDGRIERLTLRGSDKQAARDQLRREFERMKADGPYAPLMRFGDFTVYAEPRNLTDKPVFATFDNVTEQRAFSDYLKREGYTPQIGVKMGEVEKRNLPTGDFIGKMSSIIDQTSSGSEADTLKDALNQLFLRSLPEQSIRKHFIHRKFVPGYSTDALRSFAMFSRRSAKQTARLAYGDQMADSITAMSKAVREGKVDNPVAAGHLVNELEKSYQWAMAPTTATWASRLTHLGFMWHLGASPAHLFLNLSQQAQVTLPWIAGELTGKKGFASVAAALAKANKDYIKTNPFVSPDKVGAMGKAARSRIESEYGGDMGKALRTLEEAGKVDKTQTYSISGMSEEDNYLWTKPWTRIATKAAGWFFHTAEVINREATAIASYRLGRDSGMTHEQAYDFARRALNETHFDYSPSNRARFMRGNVAKVVTLFKQYSLNVTWQLGRNAYLSARGATPETRAKARTKLLGMLGMTFVMAGAAGMPLYGEVMWMMTQLLNATRDDDEPEWDADTAFRKVLDDAITPTGEQAVRRGLVNAFAGIDLSSRVKLNDLWWRSDTYDRSGKQAAYAALEQLLGPVAGLAISGYAATADAFDGLVGGTNPMGATWRAAESALPKVVKDISKGVRYLSEGEISRQGARILDPGELGYGASVGQLLGFTPAALTEKREENRAMMDLQTRIRKKRAALMDTYAMAYTQGDDEVLESTLEDMQAFNKRYPGAKITGTSIRQSLKARARRKAEMEQTGGVPLDRRLASMLMEGGS